MRSASAYAVAAVLAAPFAGPSTAFARDGLAIDASRCPALDAGEIARLLAIELGPEAIPRTAPPRIELACAGSRLRIVAFDSVTEKQLEREVDFGPHLQENRVVAILVSQLFLSSWSELLLKPPRDVAPELLGAGRAASQEARSVAERRTREALAPSIARDRAEVDLAAGARVRTLAQPLVLGRLAARGGMAVGAFEVFLEGAYERGAADRATGVVEASIVEAAAGVGWRVARRGAFSFGIEATGGPGWVDLTGASPATGVQSASLSGAIGEASLGLAPALSVGPVRATLLLQVGANFSRAVAHVAGDRDVSLGGPWLGASVSVGIGGGSP
ncbi:MAG TPA: hypothetical protein VKU41_16065 [Polyangiaceae bacterium]|nr:hypothetical protein [Polyangiaceae bacterium]